MRSFRTAIWSSQHRNKTQSSNSHINSESDRHQIASANIGQGYVCERWLRSRYRKAASDQRIAGQKIVEREYCWLAPVTDHDHRPSGYASSRSTTTRVMMYCPGGAIGIEAMSLRLDKAWRRCASASSKHKCSHAVAPWLDILLALKHTSIVV